VLAAVNSTGVYELRGNRLVMVLPDQGNLRGYEWEIQGDGRFILVSQAPVATGGSNYIGATLSRS